MRRYQMEGAGSRSDRDGLRGASIANARAGAVEVTVILLLGGDGNGSRVTPSGWAVGQARGLVGWHPEAKKKAVAA
ncbi:MAG: hypothetical protein KY432_02685 [Acidobacteria bacterium]|nr:hypothetical protein [Acidobacteriota bacterium]